MGINTYGILYPPYDALVQSVPTQSDITKVGAGYSFGVINAVNYLNSKVNMGDSVLFKQSDAVLVTAGGTDYYIVEESKIIFKENVLP